MSTHKKYTRINYKTCTQFYATCLQCMYQLYIYVFLIQKCIMNTSNCVAECVCGACVAE